MDDSLEEAVLIPVPVGGQNRGTSCSHVSMFLDQSIRLFFPSFGSSVHALSGNFRSDKVSAQKCLLIIPSTRDITRNVFIYINK